MISHLTRHLRADATVIEALGFAARGPAVARFVNSPHFEKSLGIPSQRRPSRYDSPHQKDDSQSGVEQ